MELDAQFSGMLGIARRGDIRALLGEPEVLDRIGESEVWVYQFKGGASAGRVPAAYKSVTHHYDELIMTFDGNGVLQKYTGVILGPGSRRGPK